MINLQDIDGRKIACWVNNGSFLPERKTLVFIHGDFTACDRLDLTATIAGIGIPALVVCGAEDKMTPPALSQFIRDNIPGAGLALIEGAGHFVMLENPEAFNTVLTDFVNSLR